MKIQTKIDLVMNLMYNLLLAFLFTFLAQMLNAGSLIFPGFWIDVAISYVLQMIIAMFLPFQKWGLRTAFRCKKVKTGSIGFRAITAGITSICFAIVMSGAMSFFDIIIVMQLEIKIWLLAWFRMSIVFTLVAFVCSFFLIKPFTVLAKKILHVPADFVPDFNNH